MSKPRICKSCKWLGHRAEPCCSCSRWGKGKTDYYIPAEETLGEYLKRKEQEDMGEFKTESLVHILRSNQHLADVLRKVIADRLEQLRQELIDERDRYGRLVSFKLAEAEELRALRGLRASYIRTTPNEIFCGIDEKTLKERIQEYFAEKELQTSDAPPAGAYWRNICGINARQEAKGVEKYGQRLEENTTLSTAQRIEHAQEELIDALKYLEHLKAVTGDKLTANDYQRMAMRTAGEYDTDYDQLRNAAYGLNGEAGEVIDLLKKHEFQGHDLPDDKLIDECGDVLWYCALLADALGFSLEQVMNRNIDKLRKRYPDGFDKARSINREGEQWKSF